MITSPRWRLRARVVTGAALFALGRVAAAQAGTSTTTQELNTLLAIEDSRTENPDSLRLLTGALDDARVPMRALAARALGRFERPALVRALWRAIADPAPEVRMEAVNAIAQIARPQTRIDVSLRAQVVDTLLAAARRERDAQVHGLIARSLGRVARNDADGTRILAFVSALLDQQVRDSSADPRAVFGIAHGWFSLSRAFRPSVGAAVTRRDPTTAERWLLRYGLSTPAGVAPSVAAPIRRLAMMSLGSPAVRADSILEQASTDPDAQVRRLAVLAAATTENAERRDAVVQAGLRDTAFIVRLEALRSWRRFHPARCDALTTAVRDQHPAVALAAVDALGACEDRAAVRAALEPLLAPAPGTPARVRGHASWHLHAHALVAIARVDPARARPLVPADARHPVWQVRMYAARAATIVKDTARLETLAEDGVGSVREAAIEGLASVAGRHADRIAVRALESRAYQVVLAAAGALKGTTDRALALEPLVRALDRLTREHRDNARDPRLEVLARIGELGDASQAARLEPYRHDFDPAVAERAADILTRWTGRTTTAEPRAERHVSGELGHVAAATNVRLRVTMSPASGGGTFVIRLRADAAPATAQRLIALASAGYYDGLTFHRVEPTFVIQGGSPAATEYVGDGPFMRDEVDLASHVYGTVGISTRGRDTGDAQLFVNLTDNYRLDHDYTVAGVVVEGMSVVDGILEGDTIARVTVEGYR